MDVGICGYGTYVPMYRIAIEEIAKVWGTDAEATKKGLRVIEKSVPAPDEDTATISVEAARNAVAMARIDPSKIGAVYIGSESHPYAVKPTGGIVAEAVGATPLLTTADLEFACKAGTAGMQVAIGLVKSEEIEYGLAGGADTSQGAPGDALEYTAAAGGAIFLIGKENILAKLEATKSYTTDTPDFWRREVSHYPKHGGRFTGEPAYFRHVIASTENLMKDQNLGIKDIDYVVLHQPNGKFPRQAAKKMGFSKEQVEPGIVVGNIGNTYSGSSILGFANVLDIAEPGQTILLTSYGSGAGSDSFVWTVTDELTEVRERVPNFQSYVKRKKNIDYGTYVKFKRKIKTGEEA